MSQHRVHLRSLIIGFGRRWHYGVLHHTTVGIELLRHGGSAKCGKTWVTADGTVRVAGGRLSLADLYFAQGGPKVVTIILQPIILGL